MHGKSEAMISVIIPTLNPDERFAACLSALVTGVVQGIVREVIVVDGGSEGSLVEKVCDATGARLIKASKGRGDQLAAGAEAAKGQWLLFLHADTIIEPGWEQEVNTFIERVEMGIRKPGAAAFQFALDDFGLMPRFLETMVSLRSHLLKLPYGDQALLIPKSLYREIGGYKKIPLMEDIDLVRRIGSRRLTIFRHKAVTSAVRFRNEGYLFRMFRNLSCLMLFYLKVPPRYIQRLYG